MITQPITYIQDSSDYLKIEFWNPIHDSIYFYGFLLGTLFFILIALGTIQNIFHLDWIITACFLIGIPFFLTMSEYTANNYPWVIIIDVKNNKISCSGYIIRTISHDYILRDLKKIDVIQFSEKVTLKELVSYKSEKILFVKELSFNLGKRGFSVLKIAATVEEWFLLLNKIENILKSNHYVVSIPEIQ